VSQTWQANTWYRLEVQWETTGEIVGRLYDGDGTNLLNTVTATDTMFTSGGVAFRAFDGTKYFDTIEVRTELPAGANAAAQQAAPTVDVASAFPLFMQGMFANEAKVDSASSVRIPYSQLAPSLIPGVAGPSAGTAPLANKLRTDRDSSYEQIKTSTELDPTAIDELFADLDDILIPQF
jgi:hypothetical protein